MEAPLHCIFHTNIKYNVINIINGFSRIYNKIYHLMISRQRDLGKMIDKGRRIRVAMAKSRRRHRSSLIPFIKAALNKVNVVILLITG